LEKERAKSAQASEREGVTLFLRKEVKREEFPVSRRSGAERSDRSGALGLRALANMRHYNMDVNRTRPLPLEYSNGS
jgi:hypothetical protein